MSTQSLTTDTKARWAKRIKELFDMELIDDDAQKVLTEMLESPDLENFEVLQALTKIKIREKLSEGLNDGQKEAFEQIVDFVEDPTYEAMVLKGYAGTGKTFLIKRVIEYILQTDTKNRMAVSAPTNKAVHVLYTNAFPKDKSLRGFLFEDIFDQNSRLVYSTTHKLLGMREIITDEGEQIFTADKMNRSELSNYTYMIIDEVSMLDDRLCKDIMKHAGKIRIIFMGDPAQIPPVGRADSMPFRDNHGYKFGVAELTEIMRQKGDNPIVEASFKLRDNLKQAQPIPQLNTNLNAQGHGIIHIDGKTERHMVRPLLEKYFKDPRFKDNPDFMKVIAWRNDSVDYLNSVVREILYGENPDVYMVGEKILAKKPIFEKVPGRGKYDHDMWKVLVNTSEEMEIESIEIKEHTFQEGKYKMRAKIYSLGVKVFNPVKDNTFRTTIRVIHEDDLKLYESFQKEAKRNAMLMKQAKEWVHYFNILKWSANIGYGYAITAHKSQGSTYTNVLLIEEDLDANFKAVERNRIKYTSYSRAAERLYILR